MTDTNKIVFRKDGIPLYFMTSGYGRLLILLHSFCGMAEHWCSNIDQFAQSYKVCALDLPGFGESEVPPDEDFTSHYYTNVANLIMSFIREQGYQKVSLIGNSMGGGLAIQFALLFPSAVDKLILVDSSNLGTEILFPWRFLGLPDSFMRIMLLFTTNRPWIHFLWRTMFYDKANLSADFINQSVVWARKPQSKSLMLKVAKSDFGMTIKGQKGLFLDRLRDLDLSTLIIWGENDRIIPVSHAYHAQREIRNSQLLIFQNCGHLPQIEKAEQFNKSVLSFLEK